MSLKRLDLVRTMKMVMAMMSRIMTRLRQLPEEPASESGKTATGNGYHNVASIRSSPLRDHIRESMIDTLLPYLMTPAKLICGWRHASEVRYAFRCSSITFYRRNYRNLRPSRSRPVERTRLIYYTLQRIKISYANVQHDLTSV